MRRSTTIYSMNDLPRVRLPVNSVEELLASHAGTYADKAALIAVHVDTDEINTISYRELNILVGRAAAWLSSLGIKRGDRFAILMPNAPEVIILELAGAIIGAATVPLDSKRDTIERKLFKLKDTGAKAILIKQEEKSAEERETLAQALPHLTIRTWTTFGEFQTILTGPGPVTHAKGSLEDYYVILYTSGTTALPKGVLLSTRACLLNAMGILQWQQFTHDDVFSIVLPLHHINSTEFSLAMILAGGTIVLNSRYSASHFWQVINRFRITNTSVVPTILHDLLTRVDEFISLHLDVSSLKRICIGSAPVLPEETMRFYDSFKVRVTQGYGQTETALRVAGVPVDTNEETYREFVKSNTIGTELANNHLAIMDGNNNEKNESEEGEICIAGPILAGGYLNNPEESTKSFKNSWFHSGDLGYWKMIDGKKYFFIIGRIKEIIIKGGVNLSPSAIEDALLKAFPQIDEVSVVGYPDARMGEEIAAVIVLTGLDPVKQQGSTLADKFVQLVLDAAQNGKISGLSRYESPKKVFIVDTLPKTSTGKIQRVEIKKSVATRIKSEHPHHYYVRTIANHETEIMKQALKINNARFPFIPSLLEEFIARTQNGLFFGVFDESEGLIGSLSCIRTNHTMIEKVKTWNEATAEGTLANHDPHGDTLACVAISVKTTSNNTTIQQYNNTNEDTLQRLAKKYIKEYVSLDKDHVLNFHKRSKGGIPGATVWKILENGRREDKEAIGYNVLMKYPTIDVSTTIIRSNAPSPAILLIEHALLYAKEHGVKDVIAFSRPSGFRKYLAEKLRI